MTFDQLKFRSEPVKNFCKEADRKQQIKLLVKACPHLKYDARGDTADYWEIEDPKNCSQDIIEKYLLEIYDYDALDIGRIIRECIDDTDNS